MIRDEFYFEPKKNFKPINLTNIDKKIKSISINLPDDSIIVNDHQNFDFSIFRNKNINDFKFNKRSFFSKIKMPVINFTEDEWEYEKYDVLENIDILGPFKYNGINVCNSKISKPMQLTPSSKWPRIKKIDDDGFKI